MTITYHSGEHLFHLRSRDVSYVLKVLPSGLVAHLYFGPRLRSDSLTSLLSQFDKRYPADIHTADFVGMLDLLPQ
jgi:alpha-galactosidase